MGGVLPTPLVDLTWLHRHLDDPDLIVLDASVPPVVKGFESINAPAHSPPNPRVIPGARRFDFDRRICKQGTSLPHMMPAADLFEREVRKLGINRRSRLVVYDDVGIYASPRAWWMFRAMGHEQVAVLDGGLPAWIAAGHSVAPDHADADTVGDFQARPLDGAFCDAAAVLQAIDDAGCSIIDARSCGRFQGSEAEPRPNLRPGHMPSARNLPFPSVLVYGHMKPAGELRALLEPLAATDTRLITSCGSGLTACVLTLAAELAGYEHLTVYDGSWTEWGAPSKLPVVTD